MTNRLVVLLFFFIFSVTSAQAQTPPTPIRIGGLFAQTGPAATIGKSSLRVVEMAIDQINAAGGVLGRPLELIPQDTASSPTMALRQARQLVEHDHVLAMIGPTSTETGLAVKKYIENKHIPTIMLVDGDGVIQNGPAGPADWIFKTPPRTAAAIRKIYAYLKGKRIRQIGVLHAQNAFGQEGWAALQAMADAYGIDLVANEGIDPKGTDFSAQALKLQAANPQAAVVWAAGPAGPIAAKSIAALSGTRPLLVQSHAQPGATALRQAGEAAGGTVMPGTKLMVPEALPDEDPQKIVIESFIKAYNAAGLTDQGPINIHCGAAYDAVTLLRAALEKAGKAEPAAVRNALESLHAVVGVSGVYSLSAKDHNGLQDDALLMLIVDSGRFKLAP